MRRLPGSVDELRGLRAAHWGRESTGRQADRFGPEAQREQRETAIARFGLLDTGIGWQVAHSGRTIDATGQWAEMLKRAGRDYDVLVVGYVSRFARNLEMAVTARRELHSRGAAILFADERILTSDEDAWETWAREAVEAEAYSRRLAKRIREGYAAKRRQFADQGGGLVPTGFRRDARKLVEPDPETMPIAIEAFRLAGQGLLDREIGARLGLTLWRVRGILTSPLYAGRLEDGTPTRFTAPVPTEIIEAAATARGRRVLPGGHRGRQRVYPLTDKGPLECAACGRHLYGAFRTDRGVAVYRHADRCQAWTHGEAPVAELEGQVARLLSGARPNRESAARIRSALAAPPAAPDRLEVARIDARLRALALRLVERSDRAILAEMDELRSRREAVLAQPVDESAVGPEEALEYLEGLGRLWEATSPEGRRRLAVATFARIGAVDRRILEVEPTPYAERRGLAIALPARVSLVGDTGLSPSGLTSWRIRIVGRDAWLRAVRSA